MKRLWEISDTITIHIGALIQSVRRHARKKPARPDAIQWVIKDSHIVVRSGDDIVCILPLAAFRRALDDTRRRYPE